MNTGLSQCGGISPVPAQSVRNVRHASVSMSLRSCDSSSVSMAAFDSSHRPAIRSLERAMAPVDSNNAMARLTCASSRDSASHMSMSSRRSTSPAASIASASNTVRLPSRISPPTGLPVLRLDPMTSRRSSASWNAKPRGNPIASASLRASAGARPAASIPNSKGAIVV